MGGSRHDGVSTYIYQKFMPYLTQIALSTQGDHALLATEILTSINRQGLNHPKECMQTFVALETSQNSVIAKLAFHEHRSLHEKHETILEKEYTRAVQLAFTYQHDVIQNTRGAMSSTGDPSTAKYTAKLHLLIDVLNISKVKIRKRLYESLCTRIDFDQSKLDATGDLPTHVDFSRFVIENLAFFEYATVDELLAAISAMEKVVTGTGSNVAHAIETEIFSLRMGNGQVEIEPGQDIAPSTEADIDLGRLRQLTAGSMVLSCLWEARTHLRRLYGLMNSQSTRREGKTKANVKDLNRAPTKVPFASGDKFWDESTRIMSCLGSREAMMDQCKDFVELLTVDKDFKIAAEGEDDVAAQARLRTPSDDDEASQPPSGSGRGRKRKASGTPGGRKKGARSNSKGRGKKSKRGSPDSDEDDDYGS
jgi:cohesin loading factor subunit SCC2